MLKLIFWLVVGVLALSYFGISLQGIVDSPAAHANIEFIKGLIVTGWDFLYNFVIQLIAWVKSII